VYSAAGRTPGVNGQASGRSRLCRHRIPYPVCRESIDFWSVTVGVEGRSSAVIGGRLDAMTGADVDAGRGIQTGRRWDVALSSADAQRDYVGQVAVALQARGVRCFYDADEQVRQRGTHLAEELPRIYARESAAVGGVRVPRLRREAVDALGSNRRPSVS
jgi:hypothetical protein